MSEQPETRGSPDDVTIVLSGPFTEREVALFAAVMRDCEAQRPWRLYRMAIEGPGEEGAGRALLERVFPPDPHGRTTEHWRRDL